MQLDKSHTQRQVALFPSLDRRRHARQRVWSDDPALAGKPAWRRARSGHKDTRSAAEGSEAARGVPASELASGCLCRTGSSAVFAFFRQEKQDAFLPFLAFPAHAAFAICSLPLAAPQVAEGERFLDRRRRGVYAADSEQAAHNRASPVVHLCGQRAGWSAAKLHEARSRQTWPEDAFRRTGSSALFSVFPAGNTRCLSAFPCLSCSRRRRRGVCAWRPPHASAYLPFPSLSAGGTRGSAFGATTPRRLESRHGGGRGAEERTRGARPRAASLHEACPRQSWLAGAFRRTGSSAAFRVFPTGKTRCLSAFPAYAASAICSLTLAPPAVRDVARGRLCRTGSSAAFRVFPAGKTRCLSAFPAYAASAICSLTLAPFSLPGDSETLEDRRLFVPVPYPTGECLR